jgi:hypothetical protein
MVRQSARLRAGVVWAALAALASIATFVPTAGAAAPEQLGRSSVVPGTWTVSTTPAVNPSAYTVLNGVSCVGPAFCMAVGESDASTIEVPLAEAYDGSAWTVVPVPSPPGGTGAYFDGVSCTGPRFCAAVGVHYVGGFQQNLAETWNGAAWSVTTAPDRSAGANGFLEGVSCVSTTWCIAVGGDGAGGTEESLVERWNGTAWTIVVDAPSHLAPGLSGVSCTSTSFCSAVGASYAGTEVPFAEAWNGSAWTVATTPAITGATQSLFSTVSCALPTMCMAAGYQDDGAESGNLVEQWNGTAWHVQAVPDPATSTARGFPGGIDCFGPTSCVLVGQASEGFGTGPTMVVTWDGGAWSLGSTPQPGDQTSLADSINSVSCVGGFRCVGVGRENDNALEPQPMVLAAPVARAGYYEVASDGGLFAFGAAFDGSMGGRPLNQPIVGMAVTPDGGGYWEVAADGGLFAFGDAPFFGSMGGQPLNQPIVGMAVTPDGRGYWEVAADGGLFAFGDAPFFGSMGGQPLNQPIVGMAATPDGGGYYEVAADGGIFAFGDAVFEGSMGGQPLVKPIVGIAAAPGGGYYEVASDGGLFAFGAPFDGSMGGQPLNEPIVGMALVPGNGYLEAAADGGIFAFGDAVFEGSMGGKPLVKPIVGIGQ